MEGRAQYIVSSGYKFSEPNVSEQIEAEIMADRAVGSCGPVHVGDIRTIHIFQLNVS